MSMLSMSRFVTSSNSFIFGVGGHISGTSQEDQINKQNFLICDLE